MSFVFPQTFRISVAHLPLRWLIWMPLVPVVGGTVGLAGYLAAPERLGVAAVVGLGAPLGAAIALTGLACHQITQRFAVLKSRDRDTQTALLQRDRWLQQYNQLSPGSLYILVQTADGHVRFEYMSLAIEAIHEIPVEQILQDANILLQRIHPEDQADYAQAVRQSAEQLTPFSHQWRIITPSGQVKWLQGTSTPECRNNGDMAWHGVVIDITELKQAEIALQENEKRHRTILEAIPDLMIRMHRDGTYLDVKLTDAFPVVVRAEDIGKNMADLLPEEIARKRLDAIAEVLASGEMQMFEFPFQFKEQLLWEETRILPLNQDEVVLIIRDCTQRRQMETALRQSEASLKDAQRIAQVGSWELDLQTAAVTWSEEMFHIFGFEPDQAEPSYDKIMAMIPPGDREALTRRIERAMTDHTPYSLEHRIQRPDGTQRYLISRGEILEEEHQQGIKLCGTALDITDRKQAEIALQASETRFRQLTETMKEGFFVFETETAQYSYLNPAILDLTGSPGAPLPTEPAYAKGMSHWLNHIHPEDRDRVEAQLQQERQGAPFDAEYRFLHADGRCLWLRSKAFPLVDDTGKTVRIVGTVENITDRKRLEASLRSQAAEERLLTTITQQIRQPLDLDELWATTVNAIQQTLGADRVLLVRLHSADSGQRISGQIIQAAVHAASPVTEPRHWADGHCPPDIYDHYRQGKARIVSDVSTDPWAGCLVDSRPAMAVKSQIVAPIVQRLGTNTQQVWGLLIVQTCSRDRQWQDSEANLLQNLSTQLAIALDQASLFQQLQAQLAERQQAELALQESETRFAEVAQTLNQVSYVISVSSAEYLYISPSYERLWGYSCESLYQDRKSWLNKIHPEDLEYVLDGLAQLLEGTQKRLQYRIFDANGNIRWIESDSLIVRDDAGNALRVVGIADDITDRKRLEQALRDNEELFRRAFDDAPIGISLISPAGRYLRVNKCYCDLLEYSQEELLQINFQDITHPDDLEADLSALQQMNQGAAQTFQLEKRYIAKSGTVIPVVLYASSIRDAEGTPLYSVGHVQDIREQLEVDRMKDEFVSIVSHELRTPITSIEGALMLLGAGVYDTRPEKVQTMLDIAIKNSNRLVRLVDDILSFERLESGKVELTMESCQVEDLMQQAIDSVSTLAERSAVTLKMIPCCVTLQAAPDALLQTLTNLLSNAVKFSNPRQTVWLEARPLRSGERAVGAPRKVATGKRTFASQEGPPHLPDAPRFNSAILFSVRDQGRGIPTEKLDHIFDRFQQVDVSDARQKGGTGLGLAICKRIVQKHGGEIWVESCLGRGSTFYFTVPLAKASSQHD
ncbi:PAS domain S-box protein [Halomicronema sp. CCY15110]|uniref:PAS domain S-box protein n=1 Tax=Halomicronema sp. CCY15110 TaxID=2767773 RepID=UPI0019516F58|nr:PAS domain S-box protein [Halomicronema sp. CCY15110]